MTRKEAVLGKGNTFGRDLYFDSPAREVNANHPLAPHQSTTVNKSNTIVAPALRLLVI
jgi:hypothetical protein